MKHLNPIEKKEKAKKRGRVHLPKHLSEPEHNMARFVFEQLKELNPYLYHISKHNSICIQEQWTFDYMPEGVWELIDEELLKKAMGVVK